MNERKRTYVLIIALVVSIFLIVSFMAAKTRNSSAVTLNVALYPYVPEYGSFEETAAQCFREIHPEVELNFVEWDCYSGTVSDDLDVFVFDTVCLDTYVKNGFLLPLDREDISDADDLIPAFLEGSLADGTIYAVPQMLCTDLPYTRKDDTALLDVKKASRNCTGYWRTGSFLSKRAAPPPRSADICTR
ncbi:MAG: hypothetical protein IIZ17_08215 [Eubacteriaceae bacterium]|nr:hypothetical protein [Eubacteriaceae bacterium]